MTGHTPGPWRVEVGVSDPEMYSVKGSYLVADYLPIEDARLIAAAPVLLEALRKCLNFIENTEGELGITLTSADAARAAIAKAEGRS